ncbi:hypothetical protein V7x_25800 [Crateriforma conspicua]|uniref:Uncharacterized protein n=1 Tax=Crateriforma conspicua TaxID=2527996 RepID=A0A5C6G059_9PLAN|nr:hypothetical protein V7x_25800 [Crateriforma conspicua]
MKHPTVQKHAKSRMAYRAYLSELETQSVSVAKRVFDTCRVRNFARRKSFRNPMQNSQHYAGLYNGYPVTQLVRACFNM